MQRYTCRYCSFTFSEADRSWDSAIDSGRCPQCSEPLYDFPVPVKGQRQSVQGVLEDNETMGEQNIPVKVSEEDLYAMALAEVQSGTTRPGLWAKAFADSEGDENKSKALYIKLRVQQEQKAADALVAKSARRKAAEFQSVLDRLLFNGYGVKRTATGWAVREPLGGRVKFDSDKSLLEYAQRHGVQPLPPGEHSKAGGLFEKLRPHESLPNNINSAAAQSTMATAMTNLERIMYFLLVSVALAFLTVFLVDRMLGLLAARNWAIAALAFGIGWSLNNKTKRIALTRTPYLALCAVYFIVATILRALLVPTFDLPDERAFILLGLEILSAYVFTWAAIKLNKQRPI